MWIIMRDGVLRAACCAAPILRVAPSSLLGYTSTERLPATHSIAHVKAALSDKYKMSAGNMKLEIQGQVSSRARGIAPEIDVQHVIIPCHDVMSCHVMFPAPHRFSSPLRLPHPTSCRRSIRRACHHPTDQCRTSQPLTSTSYAGCHQGQCLHMLCHVHT